MKPTHGLIFIGCLLSFAVIGCGNSSDKIVVPNQPPLSAEAAKEKTAKHQENMIQSLKDRAKQKREG